MHVEFYSDRVKDRKVCMCSIEAENKVKREKETEGEGGRKRIKRRQEEGRRVSSGSR